MKESQIAVHLLSLPFSCIAAAFDLDSPKFLDNHKRIKDTASLNISRNSKTFYCPADRQRCGSPHSASTPIQVIACDDDT